MSELTNVLVNQEKHLRTKDFDLLCNDNETCKQFMRNKFSVSPNNANEKNNWSWYYPIQEWCVENTNDIYYIDCEFAFEHSYYFLNDKDAIAFKLRWMGN